jgi:hypothetical protein
LGEWRNGRRAGFRCQCPSGRGGSSPPSPTMSGFTNCEHLGHELERGRGLCVWWGCRSDCQICASRGTWSPKSLNDGSTCRGLTRNRALAALLSDSFEACQAGRSPMIGMDLALKKELPRYPTMVDTTLWWTARSCSQPGSRRLPSRNMTKLGSNGTHPETSVSDSYVAIPHSC